jgi:hypothetical protein
VRNGPYTLVIAPEAYPGMRYRGRYCYEHHAVWWEKTGAAVPFGHVIHHVDGDKRNNAPGNLELLNIREHSRRHEETREHPIRHGMDSGYRRRGCRCEKCVSWWESFKIRHNECRRNARAALLL